VLIETQQKHDRPQGKIMMSPKFKNFARPLVSRVACGCIPDGRLLSKVSQRPTYLHESLRTA
jgi:hypothetical protein